MFFLTFLDPLKSQGQPQSGMPLCTHCCTLPFGGSQAHFATLRIES